MKLKKMIACILSLCMLATMVPVTALAETEGNCSGVCTHVAAIDTTHYDKLQDAIDDAKDGGTITLLADVTEDVLITQKKGVNLVIDGKGHDFKGVMTVFGNGKGNTRTETLTIQNIDFIAKEGADSCIVSPEKTQYSYSYSHNVTVDNCTFTGVDGSRDNTAAIRHSDGGDEDWTITNCTVDSTMHSLLQVNNVGGETGLVIDKCKVYSKNGVNLNSCTKVEIINSTFDVTGYAVRSGVKTGGNLGEEKSIILKNNTLKSECAEGDAVIMLRASAVDQKITMEENVVSGDTHFSGNTNTTKVSADGNYWEDAKGNVKAEPAVKTGSTAVSVNSYYKNATTDGDGNVDLSGLTGTNSTIPENVTLPSGVTTISFGDNAVTDGTNYYATMTKALAGIHGTDNAVLYCKPGADVGTMTHGHVCKNLTVYGNGAYISAGEQDFEIDHFKCDGAVGSTLTSDVTLKVYELKGAGAWGTRHSGYTLNLYFEDCEEIGKIYINDEAGDPAGNTNITLKNCTLTETGNYCKVYSNSNGEIVIDNCEFTNVKEPINLNHKNAGTQKVTITNSKFTNCGNSDANYAAPVRVLSSAEGGKTELAIDNCSFTGTVENSIGQGADILLDYGVGETTTEISDTNAKLVIETDNVTTSENVAEDKMKVVTVTDDETVTASNKGTVTETPDEPEDPTPDTPPTPDEPTGTPDEPTDKPKKSSSKKYSVDAPNSKDIKNGKIELNTTNAKKNSGVEITVIPDPGYALGELKVLDKNGDELKLKDLGNGVYRFTMPRGNVDIEVSFVKVETPDAKEETMIVLTIGETLMLIDGEYVVNDVAPIIRGDRTVLPIRVIAEALGATVTWNEADQTVTIVKDDITMVIYIGQAFALVNGEPVQLDQPAFIENGRTYLPLRFIMENLGADVTWDALTQKVTIVAE